MKIEAKNLKVGNVIKKPGCLFTVKKIEEDKYKNGKPCLNISCSSGSNNKIDSYFNFKLETKVDIV